MTGHLLETFLASSQRDFGSLPFRGITEDNDVAARHVIRGGGEIDEQCRPVTSHELSVAPLVILIPKRFQIPIAGVTLGEKLSDGFPYELMMRNSKDR